MYIRTTPDNREKFIKYLEENGYTLDGVREKEKIIKSVLPIWVDQDKKTYGMAGNVTVAACEAQSGVLLSVEDYMGEKKKE